jgi:adenosine kinase
MSIVCSGSVAYDYLMKFPGYFKDHILQDHLDSISLSFLVDEMVDIREVLLPIFATHLPSSAKNPFCSQQ